MAYILKSSITTTLLLISSSLNSMGRATPQTPPIAIRKCVQNQYAYLFEEVVLPEVAYAFAMVRVGHKQDTVITAMADQCKEDLEEDTDEPVDLFLREGQKDALAGNIRRWLRPYLNENYFEFLRWLRSFRVNQRKQRAKLKKEYKELFALTQVDGSLKDLTGPVEVPKPQGFDAFELSEEQRRALSGASFSTGGAYFSPALLKAMEERNAKKN